MSNSISEKTATLPKYSAETFINREEEIELVTEKAKALAQGISIDERTVVFMGQRGTGKSWLMLHLYSIISTMVGIISILIDLKDYVDPDPDTVVKKIIHQLAHILLKDQIPQEAELSDLSREFIRSLRSILTDQPLALFVDTVFEADWNLLAVLESYVLGPLAIERNVLIIMAGRGHAYPWKTPELRLRAVFHDLEGFSQRQTKSQLERQRLENASHFESIYILSQGNPLANYMLAIQTNELFIGLDRTIDELLKVVPSDERQHIREYLESLCVLNAFDEEQIPTMLAAYYDDKSFYNWKPSQARQVREKIVRWSFAHWDETKKGYVLDSTLLNLLQHYLKMETKQHLWRALNCAAYHLYNKWVIRFERTAKRWQAEAEHHLNRLKELEFSLKDCPPLEN